MLTFLSDVSSIRCLYKCDCGNEIIVLKNNVKRGHTKSCGCLRKTVTKERSTKHGHKSGGKRSRAYIAWVNMKSRCNNAKRKDAHNYIGRGINYCERWENFSNFLEDMGEPEYRMTLDRQDNSLGYSKENCRWAAMSVQCTNKRNNVRYELNGKNLTLSEWEKETGVGRATIHKRVMRGVPLEQAITFKGYLKTGIS